MADNSNDTVINVKTVADNSGAESAKKAHDKVGDAAKKAGDASAQSAQKAAGAWQKFSGAVSAVGRAIGTVTRAIGIVGFAMTAIETMVSWYKKLNEWLDRDKKAAEELARKIQDEKNKAAIEASAKAYERLREKLSEVLRLEQDRNKLADMRLNQERSLEDAKTELEMQQELAGLDRNDPDYQQNAELVRSKYARIRADRTAKRAEQDNRIAQARRYALADEKEKAANKIRKQFDDDDTVISLKRQLASEKDPKRKQNLEQQIEKLVEENRKKLADVKKLRAEAANLRKEAQENMGAYMSARISAQAVNVAQDAADADTRRQMEQNRKAREEAEQEKKRKEAEAAAKKASDEKTVAEGKQAIEGLENDADAERNKAQAAAEAYAKEQGEVVKAQNRYDMLVQNGGSKKERSAALAALQKEKNDALEAEREMEKVAAEVANTLQGINAQIKTLASAVNKAQSRLAQNQTDAPEG